MRLVFDTSTLIGCLLKPGSVPSQALAAAMQAGDLFVSAETLKELEDVLSRDYLAKRRSLEQRAGFLRLYREACIQVEHVADVKACRDPKDDKFLALSQSCEAHLLLSSDRDLLDMNPFGVTQIITAAEFLLRLRPA